MEDAIRTLDISKSVQRYQRSIDDKKVRLEFVVAQGTWLVSSHMVINTESIVGYNNKLKRAAPDMKISVNNDVNLETKKASLKLMDGGPSKINPPNSPSNPIHKQATQAQGLGGKQKAPHPQASTTDGHPSNPIHKQAMEALGLGKKKVRKRVLHELLRRQTLKSNRIT